MKEDCACHRTCILFQFDARTVQLASRQERLSSDRCYGDCWRVAVIVKDQSDVEAIVIEEKVFLESQTLQAPKFSAFVTICMFVIT
jgi:hypothetical protein